MRFDITDAPSAADLGALGARLADFNDDDVGPMDRRPLAVFLRDGSAALQAGLSGYTAWGWLYTQWLWVDGMQRGQGVAGRMLALAEAEAIARGCRAAWIDTFNPVALGVYSRAGYEPFGALPEFVAGRTRTFLFKRLGSA